MSHYIEFRNTKIHFEAKGTGEPVVLLHGFLASKEIWQETATRFSTDAYCIAIDLPGHGNSGNFSEIHSMEDMAEAVFRVLQELSVSEANFIGHSMGGYVALSILEKHPHMVKQLMLLNSTPEGDSVERKYQRDRAITLVQKSKKKYISMAISNLTTPEVDPSLLYEIDYMKENAYKMTNQGIIAALRGMKTRQDRTLTFQAFQGNKIIIAGKEDPLMDKDHLAKVAEKCRSQYYLLPGGHLSYLESKMQFWKLCISSKK